MSTLSVPTAWYRLDDGSGTTAADASGNGLAGTLVNSPTWTTGKSGGALAFNGTSQYVNVPALNLNSNTVTMSGWIKRNGTQSDYTGIVFYRNGSGTASGISMRSTGALAYHWNDVSGTYSWSSGLTVPDGVWTFVALVITPSNATMYMQPAGSAMQSAVNAVANAAQAFSGVTYIGQDPVAADSLTEAWTTCGFTMPVFPRGKSPSFTIPTSRRPFPRRRRPIRRRSRPRHRRYRHWGRRFSARAR